MALVGFSVMLTQMVFKSAKFLIQNVAKADAFVFAIRNYNKSITITNDLA